MVSSEIEEVRAAADIARIVGEYVKLRKGGANLMGLCPFHQEKTPSFAVHPVKQIFHCFGCGVGGDVFKFIMLMEHVTFPEAVERVAERVGVKLSQAPRSGADAAEASAREALFKIHELAAKFYAAQLSGTAEGRAARAYLADRGLSDEAVGRFRIGYAPGEGQALTRRLTEAGFKPEMLEKSGLILRPSADGQGGRPYDRFRRRIIFPIANERGKVIAFGGRTLGDDQPKYLNSPETLIYSKSRTLYNLDRAGAAIRKQDYAVLVEGYMDAIGVDSAGVENVVASCGTSLTESQIRLLARYARRVIVNFDPDSAGVAATERSLNLFLEAGFEVKVLALGTRLDPDGFIRSSGAAAYRERLSAAQTYLEYLTERAAARRDLRTPEGKVAAANDVMPYLARVPNPMLRAELANRLAARLGLDDRLLRDELRRAATRGEREVTPRADTRLANVSPAERLLLQAFLESEEMAREFLTRLVEGGVCEGLPTQRLFERLHELRRRGGKVELEELERELKDDEKRLIYECFFERAPLVDRNEVAACWQALERKRLERERERLQSEIHQAEGESNQARLAELMEQKSRIFKALARLKQEQKLPDINRDEMR